MPGVYKKTDFDMAGFAVGVVERKNLVTKINVSDDSLILGLESSGFHANGFSLIRNVLNIFSNFRINFQKCLKNTKKKNYDKFPSTAPSKKIRKQLKINSKWKKIFKKINKI